MHAKSRLQGLTIVRAGAFKIKARSWLEATWLLLVKRKKKYWGKKTKIEKSTKRLNVCTCECMRGEVK